MNPELVEQNYWDSSYEDLTLSISPKNDSVRLWIENHFTHHQGNCLEVGCFPGRYLAVYGELGYTLHGIDLTPRTEKSLTDWLSQCGYKVGNFYNADFLNFNNYTPQMYDVVCSFGFIEHFRNWQSVLIKHTTLVSPEGYLVIATPNFRGLFQRVSHLLLDKKNYSRHYIPSMNPSQWEAVVQKQGFQTVYKGYFGSFDFWVDIQERNFLQRLGIKAIEEIKPVLQRLPEGSSFYSPFCGLIAKKI